MSKDAAVNHYAQVGVETGVTDASPHHLVLMLLEGAIISVKIAKMHMEEHNVAEKGEAISRALAIIDEGLRASLDKKAGGEIAENLDALYAYMISRLVTANLHNQTEPLDEVTRLLSDIKGAWEEIAPRAKVETSADEPQRREPQSYGKV